MASYVILWHLMATWSTASLIPTLIHLSGKEIQTTPQMLKFLVKLLMISMCVIEKKSVCESVMLAALAEVSMSGPVVAKHLRHVDMSTFFMFKGYDMRRRPIH